MAHILSRVARTVVPLLLITAPVPASAAEPIETKLSVLASSGHGEAAYHLGMLYHLGLAGTPKNPAKAYELFKRSAELGDPLGAYKLGCFYDGQGEGIVEPDAELALKHKSVAAMAGYSLAQQDVAKILFANGEVDSALRWLEAAAAQGNLMAVMVLGGLYFGDSPQGGPSVPADRAKAFGYMLIGSRLMGEDIPGLLEEMERTLSSDERSRATAMADSWRAAPSEVTKKANSGLNAAYELAGLPVPQQ